MLMTHREENGLKIFLNSLLNGRQMPSLRLLLLAEWPSWNWSHTLTTAAGSTPVVVRSKELSAEGDSSVDADEDENLCFLMGFDFGDGVDN